MVIKRKNIFCLQRGQRSIICSAYTHCSADGPPSKSRSLIFIKAIASAQTVADVDMATLVSIAQPSLLGSNTSNYPDRAPEAVLQDTDRITMHSGNIASWNKLRRRAALTTTDEVERRPSSHKSVASAWFSCACYNYPYGPSSVVTL